MPHPTKTEETGPEADLSPRGLIGLGDLLRALAALDASSPGHVERIARALGFTGIDANPPEAVRGASGARPRPTPRQTEQAPRPPGARAFPPPSIPPREPPAEVLETVLQRVKGTPGEVTAPPPWLAGEPQAPDRQVSPIARSSLLPERTVKGVLAAAVAVRRQGPDPHYPRLIRALSRGQPLRAIPYRETSTVSRGVQLLLDTSESMTPFLDDLDRLAADLANTVGRQSCAVYHFGGDPDQAAAWSAELEPRPWRPEAGRPVLVATDLGLGARPGARDRAPLAAWLAFEQRCRAAGAPVVALVPHGRERWPAALSRRITLVHWDPRTRASHVHKLVGRGHRVRP